MSAMVRPVVSSIASFFLAGSRGEQGATAQLAVLESPARGVAASGRCRAEFEGLSHGSYLALEIRLPERGPVRRLWGFLTLPSRIRAAEARLRRCGAVAAGCYGATPDFRAPTVLYRLGGAAAAYTERRLLPGGGPWPLAWLRRALARWAGCDASVGSILVIGRKP